MWPDRRLLDLIKTELPIVVAPMAGAMDAELVIAAAQGGALGSLPCAMLSAEEAREQVNIIRQRVSAPINMNFFCHKRSMRMPPPRRDGNSGLRLIIANTGLTRRRRSMPPTARPLMQ
jgi:NAD(P)H-dependent flavin oxidoreductase YrpB (nitropropane dioxygenase family)